MGKEKKTKDVVIIDNYKDLPIGKYLEICALCRAEMDDLDRQVKIISILSGFDEDSLLDLPVTSYASLAAKTHFLESPSPDNHDRIADRYIVGNFTLVPTKDLRRITTSQYIDYQTFSKGGEEKLVEILSCFLIPDGCTYGKGYDVVEVQEAIRENLSVADCLSLCAFFLRRYHALIAHSLTYSERLLKKATDRTKKAELMNRIAEARTLLRKSGVG